MRFWLLLSAFLGAFGATLAFGLPVEAASFDCTKAQTPFEKAICADPELSKQDTTLDIAYRTAVGGLSPAATDIMRNGQRAWLKATDFTCADAIGTV